MDFLNRTDPAQPAHQSATATSNAGSAAVRGTKHSLKGENGKMWRVGAVVLLFALTILAAAMITILAVSPSGEQGKFVSNKLYQAVFLTNGQVYFGKLNEVGKDYFKLQNIYYLTQNTATSASGQQTTDGNYTLVKLGCQQIHDPVDQMIIERSQVSFWENLQDNGKVVTSIKEFQKQNPNGPDCSQVSNQTQAASGSSSATGTNSSSNTNTSTNSTKNP